MGEDVISVDFGDSEMHPVHLPKIPQNILGIEVGADVTEVIAEAGSVYAQTMGLPPPKRRQSHLDS